MHFLLSLSTLANWSYDWSLAFPRFSLLVLNLVAWSRADEFSWGEADERVAG